MIKENKIDKLDLFKRLNPNMDRESSNDMLLDDQIMEDESHTTSGVVADEDEAQRQIANNNLYKFRNGQEPDRPKTGNAVMRDEEGMSQIERIS